MLTKNEIKYIQSLGQKKGRNEHGLFIAEGAKIVHDLLTGFAGEIDCLYTTEPESVAKIPGGPEVREISGAEMEKISQLQSPPTVLAVVRRRRQQLSPVPAGRWSLMADGIQDPGNLGSIIRIADWFGVSHLYCSPDTAEPYNPKVVQAAMGSLWRVNLYYGNPADWLSGCEVPVYGTLLQGESLFSLDKPTPPGLVVVGNEGRGIRQAVLPFVTKSITIPRIGEAESLNAAVATGIVLANLTASQPNS